ncbi:TIGR03826 family flagellar region protein [Natronincola ferrireducens]|uniref:Flagellar operon protein TIGR03826 n=1 Tax=Natronincola ferrireducens TaxID=393762 RepID=A0A1G8XLG2_9FIRM|nr:TIGR03826 family flagellar region protein [Natronincola ferrireducens]SDJ90994.1 flagellar operon protein TIGR03826 [Natronincola ferrireducens]
MELKNCTKCGRAFAYTGSDLCSRCDNTDEEDFKKVKDYLYDHPGANILEVSEATEVSEKKILKFLRENRIEIREADNLLLGCERCAAPIRSGKFCDKCAAQLKKEFSSILQTNKTEPDKPKITTKSNKMYTAEIRKKFK